nr:hypothetical protein [Actinomycetota bacterium]
MTSGLGFRPRRHMTRWLDPVQLAMTGWREGTAHRADRARETMGGQSPPAAEYPCGDGEDVWFDYVADMGDAFDPTMAVAWHLGRRSIALAADDEGLFPAPPPSGLPRGRFLVMGGDEVYPYATARRYRDQTVGPYSLAFEGDGGADLFAVPGNHDWFGGLGPFRTTFCSGGTVGAWQTRQRASWFAVRLPRGWWLWGLDTGLDGTVNAAQHAYFAAAAAQLGPGDRIIACTPVPLWALYDRRPEELVEIETFLGDVVGDRAEVPLFLSGDTHAFAAFWRGGIGRTLHVTSGGGGAFLHPTHHLLLDAKRPGEPEFQLIKAWPSAERSRALSRSTTRLVWDRQSRVLIPFLALLHLAYIGLTDVRLLSPLGRGGSSRPPTLAWVLASPLAWLVLVAVVAGGRLAVAPNTRTRLVRHAARRRGAVVGLALAAVLVATATGTRWAIDHLSPGTAG